MDTFLPARALTLKKDVARRGAQSLHRRRPSWTTWNRERVSVAE